MIARPRRSRSTPGQRKDDPEFALYKDLGKGRTMHTRKMEADADGDVVEEVIVVSTDIAAPKAVAFAKFETEDGMTPQVLDVSTNMTNDGDGLPLLKLSGRLSMERRDTVTDVLTADQVG